MEIYIYSIVQAQYNIGTDQQRIGEVNFLLRKWDRK